MDNIIYDDERFFQTYGAYPRSVEGLKAAGEWETLQRVLPDFTGKRVLDLGCGYGWHCLYAIEKGASQVTGVDVSEKMLQVTEGKKRYPQRIQYIRGSIEQFPIKEKSVDVVLSSLAFHYVADFSSLCERIYQGLSDEGEFVFSVEHPIFTAYGSQEWHRDEKGEIMHWPVDQYFSEGKRQAIFLGHEMTKYHKTVTTYLMGLLNAGFTITHVIEPQPASYLLDMPGMKEELRRPMMLIVSAQKCG